MSNMKKWKNIVQTANLKESDSEDVNYTDHEVSMAKSQLLSSVKSSKRIAKHLSDKSEEEGLPGWVASKLTVAEDYLQSVADYMDGEELQEGYKVMPPMSDKYIARDGLEGPFSTLSGKVVYYDPKEGSYYDPDSDMYISYDEFQQYDNDYSGMKDDHDEVEEGNEFSGALEDAKKSGKKEFKVGGKTFQVENYQDRSNAAAATRNQIKINKSNASMPQDAVRKVSGNSSYTHATNPSYIKKANDRKHDGLGKNAATIKRMKPGADGKFIWGRDQLSDGTVQEAENETKYGIVRYPDTAISYIKNDGNGWEHIYDRSYGFKGPVAKADLKHAKKIAKEKIPSRMINEWVCGDCSAEPCQCNITEGIPKDTTYGVVVDGVYIAKGNKANMRRLAKEKDGQLMNAPGKKVGDKTASVNESTEMNEEHSPSVVKQAVAIASKMGGNMTGATAAIEKMSPGLSKHPQVAAVLKRANESQMMSESQFDEAAGEKDACYHKVKSRYKVWPSAYASGALVKCRKVGASDWGNSKKK